MLINYVKWNEIYLIFGRIRWIVKKITYICKYTCIYNVQYIFIYFFLWKQFSVWFSIKDTLKLFSKIETILVEFGMVCHFWLCVFFLQSQFREWDHYMLGFKMIASFSSPKLLILCTFLLFSRLSVEGSICPCLNIRAAASLNWQRKDNGGGASFTSALGAQTFKHPLDIFILLVRIFKFL